MNKRIVLSCALVLLFVMSGCSQLQERLTDAVKIEAETKLRGEKAYLKHQEYKEEGLLGADELYKFPESEEENFPRDLSNKVMVTTADNSFLKCIYCTDAALQEAVTEWPLYLDKGASLYINKVETTNDNSNLYEFSKFRIWAYDQNGKRSDVPFKEVSHKTGTLLTIPKDFTGTGFSIEPLGKYTDRQISVRAYYVDDGREKTLDGTWMINNKPVTDQTQISPVDSYTLIYNYSDYADDYYYVSSSPRCWYPKESNHTVIFCESSSSERNTTYSVCLHPFITLTVQNKALEFIDQIPLLGSNGKGIIQYIHRGNDDLTPEDMTGSHFTLRYLRAGDRLTVRINNKYKLVGDDVGDPRPLGSNAENGYEYTIEVPDTNNGIKIAIHPRNSNPNAVFPAYLPEHAVLNVKLRDEMELQPGDELPGDNETVVATLIPANGYYITGYNTSEYSYSFEMKFADFEKNVQQILSEHPARAFVKFGLTLEDEVGHCVYWLDGQPVNGSEVTACEGQKLKIEFTANAGYTIVRKNWLEETWSTITNFVTGILGGNSNSASAEIEVHSGMNGITVTREHFGIEVEKER